jgi:hypothetical protein
MKDLLTALLKEICEKENQVKEVEEDEEIKVLERQAMLVAADRMLSRTTTSPDLDTADKVDCSLKGMSLMMLPSTTYKYHTFTHIHLFDISCTIWFLLHTL